MTRWLFLLLVTLGLTGRRGIEGKTIDVEEAILRVPPSGFHASQPEDLFGYSGALHHTTRTSDPLLLTSLGLAEKLNGAR